MEKTDKTAPVATKARKLDDVFVVMKAVFQDLREHPEYVHDRVKEIQSLVLNVGEATQKVYTMFAEVLDIASEVKDVLDGKGSRSAIQSPRQQQAKRIAASIKQRE